MKYIKKFNTLEEQTAYLAEADIDTYLGYVDENDTVYYEDAIPPHDYSKDYLTIESTSDNNTIYLKASDSTAAKTVSASTDNGATWTEYTSSSADDNGTALATLNTGEKLLVKGENSTYVLQNSWNQFKSTGQFEAYGNIMSLVSGDSFANADTLTEDYALYALFNNCSTITSAENLVLPATTLTNNCYRGMFNGCTSLTTAPELPATTLAEGCYQVMFQGCTSLTTAPVLPATTLAQSCYSNMFQDCTSLMTAPVLSAKTLARSCYQSMFNGCTSLNYIKCLATGISASRCTYNWVNGVASTGTFVKNASMTRWTTGYNGIPSGWTVQDA